MSIIATRSYLERKGMPKVPRDILQHDTICYGFGRSGQLAPWSFKGPDGGFVIQPKPRLVANDMRSLLHYAAHGLGLAYAYAEIAAPYLAKKDIVEVLTKDLAPFPRYSINYRSKKHMTRRLRAFLYLAKRGSHIR